MEPIPFYGWLNLEDVQDSEQLDCNKSKAGEDLSVLLFLQAIVHPLSGQDE